MKKIILLLIVTIVMISCSGEPAVLDNQAGIDNSALTAKSSSSTSAWGDYIIALAVTDGGKVWTYTITRNPLKPNAKNLSHFIIDLNNCGDDSAIFANINQAYINGVAADLVPTEGSGTTCFPQATTTNFVKFNAIPAATSWTLVLVLERGYSIVEAVGWLKAGTSCNSATIPGPGCPLESYCSYSQGYFFANGATHNGAKEFWKAGLTIGGFIYTQEQGNAIWFIDRGRGGDKTLNAFFQLGAARLSGIESAVEADAAIIDAYFAGIGNIFTKLTTTTGTSPYSYFDLPSKSGNYTKTQVIDAGSSIGEYIDSTHCP
jgi:hypothetical protein